MSAVQVVYHEKHIILPDVGRVLACLYEKDIEFKTVTSSYWSLMKLQASTHAPVPFYDGPLFLEDSREICRYVAEKYEHIGYSFLLGEDALERASVEQWLHNEEHAFAPPARVLFCQMTFGQDEESDDPIDLKREVRKLEEVLEIYERRLTDVEYLAGDKFTLADLVHMPNCHAIYSGRFSYLFNSRNNVLRWWKAISSRRSWQRVLDDMYKAERQRKLEVDLPQWQRKYRKVLVRQVRPDPRKHIIARSETIPQEKVP